MNIEKLSRDAINYLKETYDNFPKTGIIAGGSLANLIWESVSGHKAQINDVDVFILEKVVDRNPLDTSNWLNRKDNDLKKLFYHKKEDEFYEDYTGLCVTSKSKDFYYIEKTSNSDIYNYIHYSANRQDPQIIIESFDINCTGVGYSIDEDKFYYTDEFLDFLKTGKIQLTNLMSPAHSAIRLVKKKYDLNAQLDELELKFCQHCLKFGMSDTVRRHFTDKYAQIFKKYESDLSPYFDLRKDDDITELFLNVKKIDLDIYTLDVIKIKDENSNWTTIPKIFENANLNFISSGQKLLFYFRNIYNQQGLQLVWDKLHFLYDNENYIDTQFSPEDVEMLHRLIQAAPKTINNLKGLKLSQQISIMKKMFDKYKEDPIIAISIMEKMKINPDTDFDEGDLLLLELFVRKEIINDTRQKVKRVIGKSNSSESDEKNQEIINLPF